MDRMELLHSLIVFLLAALVYETGDGNTPQFVVIPVLVILFLFPIYVAGAIVTENL